MRDTYLMVRLNQREKQAIEHAARSRSQDMSEFVRDLLRIATINFSLPTSDTSKNHNDAITHHDQPA